MEGFATAVEALLAIFVTTLVYRHASGQHTLNKGLVVFLCCLSLITCLPALLIGYNNNPNRGLKS